MTTANDLMGLGMHPELAKRLSTDLSTDRGTLYESGTIKWAVSSGDLAQNATNGRDLVMSKANTALCPAVATALVAAGTTIADALQLTKAVSSVSTVASGTGVKLWAPSNHGAILIVKNSGASDLKVYPPTSGATINFGSAGAGITLTTAAKQVGFFVEILTDTWIAGTMAASA